MSPPGQCPRSVAMDLPAPPPNGTSQCPFTAALPSVSLSSNVPFQLPRIRSQPVSPPGRAVPSPSGSGPQSTPSKWHLHSPFVLSVSSWTAFPRSGSGTRSRAVTSPPPWQRPFLAALHSVPSHGVSPLGQCCFLLVAGELSVPSPSRVLALPSYLSQYLLSDSVPSQWQLNYESRHPPGR